MRTTIRSKALTGGAIALLTLAIAGCTDDPAPEPTDLEPAPVGQTSDGGGETPTNQGGDDGAGAAADACSLPTGEQALPNDAPPVDEWVTVGTISGVPTSDTFGPEHRSGDLFTCYSQSPTGALFASVYAIAASGEVQGFADVWLAPGPIQDEMRQSEEQGGTSGTEGLVLSGYRIHAASEEEFVVDLAITGMTDQGQGMVAQRVVLQWEEDRWVLDPATFENSPSPISDLTGFTPWNANA